MKKIYFLLLICFVKTTCFAQTVSIDDDKSAGFKGGVSYLNNNVFMGRTDIVTSRTITPELLYTFKSGFYVSGTANLIINQKRNFLDGGDLEAGYNYAVNDNLYGGLSFSKYFYSTNSTRITSAISSFLNAYLNYDLGDIITPEISVSYSISSRKVHNDVFVSPGLMHLFSIDNLFNSENTLDIGPEFTLNTGTQNFYNGYFIRRKRNTTTAANQISSADEAKLTQFTLLDYEASLPLKYKAKNYLLSFTPSYAFPQNKLPDNVTSKLADKKSIFYFEASVLYKF